MAWGLYRIASCEIDMQCIAKPSRGPCEEEAEHSTKQTVHEVPPVNSVRLPTNQIDRQRICKACFGITAAEEREDSPS